MFSAPKNALLLALPLVLADLNTKAEAQPGTCIGIPPAPSQLVSWWPLDEPSGATAHDIASGIDGDIVFYSSQAGFVSGKVGNAYHLKHNGYIDYVHVPNDPLLNFGTDGDFTIDAWISLTTSGKLNDGGVEKVPMQPFIIFEKMEFQAIDKAGYSFNYSYNGYLSLSLEEPGLNQLGFSTASPISLAGPNWPWVHVAVTVDRDTDVTFYVNGSPVAKLQPQTNSNGIDVTSNAPGSIGPVGVWHKEGRIDEVEVFSRALAASEVQTIAMQGKCKLPQHAGGGIEITPAPTIPPELSIEKATASGDCEAGQPCTFTVTITNNGGLFEGKLSLLDVTEPSGLTLSALPPVTCDPSNSETPTTCYTDGLSLQTGGQTTYTFTIIAPSNVPGGVLTNCVTLFDEDGTGLDEDCVDVEVLLSPPDLTIAKSSQPSSPWVQGVLGTFTIQVANIGAPIPEDAIVIVTENFPAYVIPTSWPTSPPDPFWDCQATSPFTCTYIGTAVEGPFEPLTIVAFGAILAAQQQQQNCANVNLQAPSYAAAEEHLLNNGDCLPIEIVP